MKKSILDFIKITFQRKGKPRRSIAELLGAIERSLWREFANKRKGRAGYSSDRKERVGYSSDRN